MIVPLRLVFTVCGYLFACWLIAVSLRLINSVVVIGIVVGILFGYLILGYFACVCVVLISFVVLFRCVFGNCC